MPQVNNEYYHGLGERWYQADNDPIAVLRAEQNIKNPWVLDTIQQHFATSNIQMEDVKIADIGCGAGFLTNYLAKHFNHVTGIDASENSLEIAKQYDDSGKVIYTFGDAYHLPFEDQSLEVVCAMDFLEHVEDPKRVIAECSRVLKPGGLFFYHTFNRNWLSYLIVIKFMEWFVPNTPKNLHVLHLFIKPSELKNWCREYHLTPHETIGLGPKFNKGFFKSLLKRRVTSDFQFELKDSLKLGYIGFATKEDMSL
ncbi:MAG: 3-demethylubiquinone-9 3-O-methyltransferase [Halobacteriovoraceae bacterium]|nr:3-demethylubiquinone-9 3-O-methyltransferase [Halobacteriovoraceae bacterium]